jgi:hypothetical protein
LVEYREWKIEGRVGRVDGETVEDAVVEAVEDCLRLVLIVDGELLGS